MKRRLLLPQYWCLISLASDSQGTRTERSGVVAEAKNDKIGLFIHSCLPLTIFPVVSSSFEGDGRQGNKRVSSGAIAVVVDVDDDRSSVEKEPEIDSGGCPK